MAAGLRALFSRAPLETRDGVLEFVDVGDDYCDNFGRQWNLFRSVQIDSESLQVESAARFFAETGWQASDLGGKVILDAGCGAGRFSEVAVRAGARLVAIDLSSAAYACAKTLEKQGSGDYIVARANIFDLPLRHGSFDGIYSLGVLQHTPDPLGAIRALVPFLKPGGRLATWIYELGRFDYRPLLPRTWIRHATASWPSERKLVLSKLLTAAFFPAGWGLSWLGRWGERAAFFLPYAARHHFGRGDLARQWSYSLMDTFDWYGPLYDDPQREADIVRTMESAGLVNIRRLPARGMAIVGERSV